MTALARGAGPSGAECDLSGEIPIYATWSEDLYFFDPDGAPLDISELSFEFQFRCDPSDTGANVTLSTDGGTLSIEADEGSVPSILRISSAAGTFSAYAGDLVADLVATDSTGNKTLYAHGIVTFTNNPAS